ncbi:YggS family pyridoxal phosphate-dependent enzyme [Peptoniphilus catoniae]|uniref:YggS family pyridoxal phosphate-dependent enzyme n=1 Tax=Peptoniphilus catoniae TaxID=1660341 RepID=UPI0010FD07E6|nr:YggS family pyridoxal phosphate-dependent enzyme [Peptoniphilus catoniae]
MTIKDNINKVFEEIEDAKKRSAYSQDVKLIAVSKMHSIEEIMEAYNLGIRDFGENKVQELKEKIPKLPNDINFHMIGNLQTNKVKYIYDKVVLIQSVDNLKLLSEIDKRSKKDDIKANVLIQVNISKEPQKGGVDPLKIMPFIEKSIDFDNIKVKGLMGMAPLTDNEEVIRTCFRNLYNIREEIKKMNYKEIDMAYLSMGMSGDFKIAIEEGSNMIRVGTKIFGKRNYY